MSFEICVKLTKNRAFWEIESILKMYFIEGSAISGRATSNDTEIRENNPALTYNRGVNRSKNPGGAMGQKIWGGHL